MAAKQGSPLAGELAFAEQMTEGVNPVYIHPSFRPNYPGKRVFLCRMTVPIPEKSPAFRGN